jgi:type IV conjugative transfer system protein TraE
MNHGLALKEKDNMRAAIRLLRFVVIVIGIAVCYMAFKVERAVEYQKTILVPYGFDRQFEVTGKDVSDEVAEFFGRRITSLRYTFSPGTARKSFNRLLSLYSAEAYPEAWKAFYDLADRIETANVSSVFYLETLSVDRGKKQITVEGNMRKYKDNTPLGDTRLLCIISYQVDHGMFQLQKIEEREKK